MLATDESEIPQSLKHTFDKLIERSLQWGFVKTAIAMLATYIVSWGILSGVFFAFPPGQGGGEFTMISLAIGVLVFLMTLIFRGIFKWTVHPFSMGLGVALALFWTLCIYLLIGRIAAETENFSKNNIAEVMIIGGFFLTIVIIGGLHFRISRLADERRSLPKLLELFFGLCVACLICRIWAPETFIPTIVEEVIYLKTQSPLVGGVALTLGVAAFAALRAGAKLRRYVYWFFAIAICLNVARYETAIAEFGMNGSLAGSAGFLPRDYVLTVIAPVLMVLAVPFLHFVLIPAGQFLFAPNARDLRGSEAYGALLMPLDHRAQRISIDIFALLLAIGVYALTLPTIINLLSDTMVFATNVSVWASAAGIKSGASEANIMRDFLAEQRHDIIFRTVTLNESLGLHNIPTIIYQNHLTEMKLAITQRELLIPVQKLQQEVWIATMEVAGVNPNPPDITNFARIEEALGNAEKVVGEQEERLANWGSIAKVLGFCWLVIVMLCASLLSRIFFSKRLRLFQIALLAVFVLTVQNFIALSLQGIALENTELYAASWLVTNNYQFWVQFLLGYLTLVAGAAFIAWRGVTARVLIPALKFFIGALVAAFIVEQVGGNAADRILLLELSVGEVATLAIIGGAGAHFWYMRRDPFGFITWPLTAFFASCVFATLFRVQDRLSELQESIATGWSEILVSVIFGLGMAHLGLLAKRIWHDKDPVARQDAVRVRGGLYILYGVWPLVVFTIVLLAFAGFRNEVSDELKELSDGVAAFNAQGERIAQMVSQEADLIAADIAEIEAAARGLGLTVVTAVEEIPGQLTELGEESLTALKNAGEAVVEQGTEAARDAIDRAGDKLTEGLPSLDFGIFGEISLPDLGLAELFSGAFEWDTGFQNILDQFVGSAMGTITAEFEGPISKATAIATSIQKDITDDVSKATASAQALVTRANAAADAAQNEFTIALARADLMIIQAISFLKHLAVLLFYITLAVALWLTWRAIAGIAQMAERVRIGWVMMVEAHEADVA